MCHRGLWARERRDVDDGERNNVVGDNSGS